MRYIGVDVGKKRYQAHITDEEGVILDEFPFDNTFNGIGRLQQKTK
jgi:transposase